MAENALGRNQVFAIKNADGTPFHDLVMYKATYDSVVMSLGDKITGDVYYKDNRLDVTMNEYIEFKRDPDNSNEEPVKFVLVSPPTIIKEGIVSENSELKGTTKYSFEFYHPMYKLGNMPLTDIAVTSSEENYLSQNKTFSWCGTGNDFIAKLNANLSYSEWVVVASTNAQSAERLAMMPSDVPTKKAGEQAKSNVLSFDKNTIADGLRTIYETWDIPFVVDTLHQGEYYDINGNDYYSIAGGSKRFVVVVGMPSNEIIDTGSKDGVVVQATSLATGNIYYNPQPINAQKGKKIIVESLTESAVPIILNSSHNGVIGTTSKTFEADMTIYVGLYAKSGFVRYVYDGEEGSVFIFRYGQGVGLKNNSRTPRNNKIITRISASGSEDNIPYGYPQIKWTGESSWNYTINNASGMQTITVGGRTIQAMSYPIYDGIVGGQKVRLIKHPFTRTRLMPSVYVESVNKKVNPSHPQYDPDIELVDYYDADNTYENPIVVSSPSYEIHEFDGIKPELDSNRQIAILGAIPLNDDLTPADYWVDDLKPDSDEYTQSYFRITLPPLGFDVYACASITQQMQINMRSGACIGCTFEIQVDWDDYKVNFYDSEGNFDPAIGTGHPRDAQKYPNSTTSPINVTVKKETSTFGTLMPNIYQQPKNGDLFVILGISLPASYITEAQQRLDNTAKQYMRENNLHYFDYPLKFDEYFLAKHPSILRQIRTNTIVRFDYAGHILHLCVKQITIKFGEKALPQYNITLTDNIEVVLNQISQIANDVSRISTMAYQNAKQAGQGGGGSGNAQDKLSKVSDDTASGLITFLKGIKIGLQKLFGWDSEGNITANNVTAEDGTFKGDVNILGLLTSLRAKINEIRSANNAGSGLFESGWFITNSHNGHSYMEVDELLVRMKAVFMELEIRKETHSGGNVFYSPAGSVIYRVEYYNANGERIGITKTDRRSPITAGGKMLSLFKSLGSTLGIFSYDNTIITEVPVDHSQVAFYRCYLIADDGTVQTRNWWHENDQARCQTFNRASQKTETGQSDAPDVVISEQNNYIQDKMDGNRFYWRLVLKAGSKKLEDGKWYDYVDLSNRNAGDGYVMGSDYPAVGDTIVCVGNRTNPERMNLVMLEVIGDDAPAIKMYRGINSFSFDGKKFWNIGNKLQFRADSIEYVTGSGQVLPPKIPLGPWVRGQRYHYYEEVSNEGCLWLCSITDGYRWEEADGTFVMDEMSPMFANEGTFAYGDNLQFTEHYYNTMEYDGETVYLVHKYTIAEPSDNVPSLWSVEVAKGEPGHVELTDEDMDEIASRVTDLPAGYTICINPEPLFINQNTIGKVDFYDGNTYYYFADVTVYDHNGNSVPINLSSAKAYGRNGNNFIEMNNMATVINNSRLAITGISNIQSGSGEYEYSYDNGYIDFSITIQNDVLIEHQKLCWYLNRLGNRVVRVMGDASTTYCTKTEYNSNGGVVKKNEFNSMFETSAERIYARLDVNESDISELEITANGLKSSVSSSNLENLIDNTGWKTWESESTAIYDADTMRVINLPNEDDLYSNAVFLERNKTYVFSLYTNEDFDTEQGVQVVRFYKCGDNPDAGSSSLSEFVYCPVSTIATDVYQNQPRRYCTITPNSTEYYKVDVYGPTSFYRSKLEGGSIPTTWFATSSEIKQTADSINLSIRNDLATTGIYINGEDKRIDMQAEKFTLKNSNNQQTMGVDGDGNIEVLGTVRANNFFRTVALSWGNFSIRTLESGGATSMCIFIKSLNRADSPELAEEYGFSIGDYFTLTESMISSGEFDDGMYNVNFNDNDFIPCTGNADIVCLMDYYGNGGYQYWHDGDYVYIPRPEDFFGKTIEIFHKSKGEPVNYHTAIVATVTREANKIVWGPYLSGYNIVYTSYGAASQATYNAGQSIVLYSNGSVWIELGRKN